MSVVRLSRGDSGSAIIEFVLLAVPLLIPMIMYLGMIHENSVINSDLHNLARQGARAFITSSDDIDEGARMQAIVQLFTEKVFVPHGISQVPAISVECSSTPCLSANSRVKVTASLHVVNRNLGGFLRFISAPTQDFSASDVQIVDAWR
jgi:Flp pilus assembly protein TadG